MWLTNLYFLSIRHIRAKKKTWVYGQNDLIRDMQHCSVTIYEPNRFRK